jgi:hypothetical protein
MASGVHDIDHQRSSPCAPCCSGIPQRLISGTSLAAVATTGATAGYVYWSSGSVDVRYAGLLAAGAVLTAPLGARATHLFNCHVSVWRVTLPVAVHALFMWHLCFSTPGPHGLHANCPCCLAIGGHMLLWQQSPIPCVNVALSAAGNRQAVGLHRWVDQGYNCILLLLLLCRRSA